VIQEGFMASRTRYRCACGEIRKETNHWFALRFSGEQLNVYAWDVALNIMVLQKDLSNRLLDAPGTIHLCGQACVHKAIDAWMSKDLEYFVKAMEGDNGELSDS
jgi:hypothetical protein